jgi:hypothetical protein
VPVTTKAKKYWFERFPLSASRVFSEGYLKEELGKIPGFRNTMKLEARERYVMDTARHLVLELTGWILRDKHEHEIVYKSEEITIDVPATWWDMLKQDNFPESWLKRWPVKTVGLSKKAHFEYEQQIRVCPHANVAWPDERHLNFLTFKTPSLRETGGFTGVWGPGPKDPDIYCPSCGVGLDTDGDGNCVLCGPPRKRKKSDDSERPAKYEG